MNFALLTAFLSFMTGHPIMPLVRDLLLIIEKVSSGYLQLEARCERKVQKFVVTLIAETFCAA